MKPRIKWLELITIAVVVFVAAAGLLTLIIERSDWQPTSIQYDNPDEN